MDVTSTPKGEIRARPVSALGRIGNHMAAMVPERVQFSDMEPEQFGVLGPPEVRICKLEARQSGNSGGCERAVRSTLGTRVFY
ncbi:hypothetical protein KXW75_002473 [Aspergillus fumigatus]|nr:hypothetical protein KXX14_006766 [Aspergillus fumigatus]KAH1611605.1 hypothetical protein KXX31_006181 [Aspergillus fumigatus]KAH2100658.1 hypothetical protein KXW75_002473 [Aspergillus fumigatus]KAH2295839.1 hypothetical protein KXW82_008284 [Aspergillus fumigatus]KAH2719550.1 hypothetical protein KXW29_002101 [Aspergillus fumigatus]